MEYIKVSKAAEKWGISARRVRILCAEGKIDGVIRKGNLYMIPENAQKPRDGRLSKYNILDEIEEKKAKLDSMRPLTPGEVKRLREEFMIEFTHNSTAIEGNTLTLKETAMVLEGMTIDQKPLKDHLEAVGHRDAFLYVCDIATREAPLNESTIKNIHSLVLMNQPEDKGVYRKIPVRIMGAYTEPVQPYLIEPKITELLASNEERKATMSVIERVALFHLEFEVSTRSLTVTAEPADFFLILNLSVTVIPLSMSSLQTEDAIMMPLTRITETVTVCRWLNLLLSMSARGMRTISGCWKTNNL